MFIDEKTQTKIYAPLCGSLSWGTMRPQDMIPRFLDALRDTPEYVQFMNVFPSYAAEDDDSEWWDSEDAADILSELFDVLQSYAPDGYNFGSSEADGSDYGFWPEDYEPD